MGVLSGLGPIAGRILTNKTHGDTRGEPDAAKVQGQYNTSRDKVRDSAKSIGFQGGYRTPSVKTTDNFEQHNLATLRSKVDHIDLEVVSNLQATWAKLASDATNSLNEFHQGMMKGTDPSMWRGQASQALAAAVNDHTTNSTQVAHASALTGNKLSELATGLTPTKELVPHVPSHRSGWQNFVSWGGGRGWRDDATANSNAYAEAKRVLNTVYAPVVHETDNGVPVIPTPGDRPAGPGPGNQTSTPPPATAGRHGPDAGGPGGDGNRPPGQNPGDHAGQDRPGDANPNKPNDQGSQQHPSGADLSSAPNPSGTDPASSTKPSGMDSASPGSKAPATSVPTGPGAGSGAGFPGETGTGSSVPGGGGTAIPGAGRNLPGRSIPGGPARPGTGTGRPAAASAKPGAGGVPGMGVPGKAQRDKDNERTKGVPDYLITKEHGDELTGIPELPKRPPPVIGDT